MPEAPQNRRAARLRYRALRLRRGVSKLGLLSFGQPPPTPFMVLCRPRTGSNYLLSMLEHHSQTLVYGEKLRAAAPPQADRFIDRLGRRRACWVRAVGFKMFYEHPHGQDGSAAWARLVDDRQLRIIHLRRSNLLHVLLSEHIAKQTDQWVVRSDQQAGQASGAPVHLSAQWLAEGFERIRSQEQAFAERFALHPCHDIEFEQLTAAPQPEFDRICDFLGLARQAARGYTVRQRRRPTSEVIANFDALAEHFSGTRWAAFFRR